MTHGTNFIWVKQRQSARLIRVGDDKVIADIRYAAAPIEGFMLNSTLEALNGGVYYTINGAMTAVEKHLGIQSRVPTYE